ncbi:MAG: cell division protein ZapD [Gammaproteobacteria bacterium]|nr:cell division protein ZapD [Gammaproteobacteria bacterium]
MNQAAEATRQQNAADKPLYEQPLNERMRTFLRLEFLYKQLCYQAEKNSAWASRDAIDGLLDIVSILSRGDVRGDVLKELERQLFVMERLQQSSDIDVNRLQGVTSKLKTLRGNLSAIGPKYLQELRDNEFLNAIRHRSSIPGGTCAFDIPEYTHWLRQDYGRRAQDVGDWVEVVRPICEAVMGLLWIVRNSKQPSRRIANAGVYHHSMNRESINGLIRIELNEGAKLYPEISGSQHRFSVRFMQWNAGETRPGQTADDIEFELTVC